MGSIILTVQKSEFTSQAERLLRRVYGVLDLFSELCLVRKFTYPYLWAPCVFPPDTLYPNSDFLEPAHRGSVFPPEIVTLEGK